MSGAVESHTAANTTAKIAALEGFVRRRGSTVWVRFTAGNTALNPTLNINNTGAALIQLNGAALNDASLARQIAPNVLYGFVFDGTVWQMIVLGSSLPTLGQGFGTVFTAAATIAKEGVLNGFTRRLGSVVWLRFTVHNAAVGPTLNINHTGAAAIQLNGSTLPAGAIAAGGVYGFVFDGVNWQILNPASHPHSADDIIAGRLQPARLPTSSTANSVLTVLTPHGNPGFVQVNSAMMAANSVGTAHIQNGSVTEPKIANLAVTSSKIADFAVNNRNIANGIIRQEKLLVMDGFAELGLNNTATLVDVINAIRALPFWRPVSVRISIMLPETAQRLRAPLSAINSMMQIERAQNNSNLLTLTYFTGLNTPNGLRVFYANHANADATNASVDAVIWREIPLLFNGRILPQHMPTTPTANTVLAVGSANTTPSFVQVNNAMIADNAVTATKIANVMAIDRNIAIGTNAFLIDSGAGGNTAIGSAAHITVGASNSAFGASSSITGGDHNLAIGNRAQIPAANSFGNIAIGEMANVSAANAAGSIALGLASVASHVNAAIIATNTGWIQRTSQAANSVTLGNSTTTVGGWSPWNNLSDARDKCDATPLKYNPLSFINALTPKQYRTDFRSNYRCYQEITEKEHNALNEYDKRHRIHETDVYTITGTNIEWIEDASIITNNGRLKDITDAPDFLKKSASRDRYKTKYQHTYTKSKEVAIQKFKEDKCIDSPAVAEAWKLYCETHGNGAQADSFIESCIKVARKAKFLVVELEPDGTYAGKRYHWGFMAQEVEQAAKDMGIDCPAVKYLAHNKDKDGVPQGDDLYTMGYTELIAPLVGAVQQLTGTVQQLQEEIAALKKAV